MLGPHQTHLPVVPLLIEQPRHPVCHVHTEAHVHGEVGEPSGIVARTQDDELLRRRVDFEEDLGFEDVVQTRSRRRS